MSSITAPVTTIAPDVTTFGPGGQQYIMSMRGGFNVSPEVDNELFAFARTNSSVANAKQLTNLTEPRKIGSTMSFRAVRLGIRILSFKESNGAAVPNTPEEVAAMKQLLASAEITITAGSNDTKIAEFSGLDLMEPIDFMAADSTNTCAAANGLGGGIGWIPLAIPIEFQANVNIGGSVKFTRPVPTDLTTTANSFGFVVIFQGLKIVKS